MIARHGLKVRKRLARRAVLVTCACGYVHNVLRCPQCGAAHVAAAGRVRAKPRFFEDRHQAALFRWVRMAVATLPDLAKLYHVPNGGARNEIEGKRLKEQGVRKGQLDLNLDVARGGYFGLRIELKALKAELGRNPDVSPEQQTIIAELQADGYAAEVCEGWEEARDCLLAYLSAGPTVPAAPPGWHELQTPVRSRRPK